MPRIVIDGMPRNIFSEKELFDLRSILISDAIEAEGLDLELYDIYCDFGYSAFSWPGSWPKQVIINIDDFFGKPLGSQKTRELFAETVHSVVYHAFRDFAYSKRLGSLVIQVNVISFEEQKVSFSSEVLDIPK